MGKQTHHTRKRQLHAARLRSISADRCSTNKRGCQTNAGTFMPRLRGSATPQRADDRSGKDESCKGNEVILTEVLGGDALLQHLADRQVEGPQPPARQSGQRHQRVRDRGVGHAGAEGGGERRRGADAQRSGLQPDAQRAGTQPACMPGIST